MNSKAIMGFAFTAFFVVSCTTPGMETESENTIDYDAKFQLEYKTMSDEKRVEYGEVANNLFSFYAPYLNRDTNAFMNEENKNIHLKLNASYDDDLSFNTIYLHYGFLDYVSGEHLNLPEYDQIVDMLKFGDGDSLLFPEAYDSESRIEDMNDFIEYADLAVNAKYVMIQKDTEIIWPTMSMYEEGYTPGSYKGTVALFDIKTRKLVGQFDFLANNSNEIEWVDGSTGDALVNDLLINVRDRVHEKLKALYTVEGYISTQYDKDKDKRQLFVID